MLIVGGRGSNGIDVSIAKLLKAKHIKLDIHEFPDGEYKVQLPEKVEGEDVLIVQSLYYPQDQRIFELLLIADLLKDMGARRVGAVIPYLAFARQDKRFIEGESLSIKTLMNLLNSVGIDYLLTVQPHKKEPLGYFKGKVVTVEPIETLAKSLKSSVANPFVLAPDKGSAELAKAVAKTLKCDSTHIDKERDHVTGAVRIKSAPDIDLKGKDVIILDDMISTGGTIVTSSEFAYSKGAKTVVTAAVHLVMADKAKEKLEKVGVKRIFGTNTIPYKGGHIADISEDIAKSIKESFVKEK